MRLFTSANKDGVHQSNALSWALEWLGGKFYLAIIPIRPSSPTIVSQATAGAGWTLVATDLTNILEWRLSELNGNDFDYAYEVAPGDNFSTAFGWVSWQTAISSIYVRRKGTADITVKLETWKS